MKREFSLKQIKTYNQIKAAIWNCVLERDPDGPEDKQLVDLVLLRDLIRELQSMVDFELIRKLTKEK